MTRQSNRIVDGKPVAIDEREGADNSAAHGYDTEPGRKFNERFHADAPAKPATEERTRSAATAPKGEK